MNIIITTDTIAYGTVPVPYGTVYGTVRYWVPYDFLEPSMKVPDYRYGTGTVRYGTDQGWAAIGQSSFADCSLQSAPHAVQLQWLHVVRVQCRRKCNLKL